MIGNNKCGVLGEGGRDGGRAGVCERVENGIMGWKRRKEERGCGVCDENRVCCY